MSPFDFRRNLRALGFVVIVVLTIMALIIVWAVTYSWVEVNLL